MTFRCALGRFGPLLRASLSLSSVVHVGRYDDTNTRVAIKDIDITDENGDILYRTEVRMLKKLPKHKNLPEFYGASYSTSLGVGSIVMTYLPFPTVANYVQKFGPVSPESALKMLEQVVRFLFQHF